MTDIAFRSAQESAHAGNIFSRVRDGMTDINNSLEEDEVSSFRKQEKSCKALSLSCYLASLTFIIIMLQSSLSWLKDLTTKDEFWESTQKFLDMYDQYNKTMMEANSSDLH